MPKDIMFDYLNKHMHMYVYVNILYKDQHTYTSEHLCA